MSSKTFEFDAKAYPDHPGIYRMLGADSKTLYIGKATSLKKRLSQYFQKKHDGRFQIDLLVPQVCKIECIATDSERDALILENQLIKKYKPKYNIRLKDDKSYPYIRLSKDDFPRIEVSREKDEENYTYFGPYTVVGNALRLVEFISMQYGVRRCPGIPMKFLDRPCLYAQIGQCSAPCIKMVSKEDYGKNIAEAKKLLNGKTRAMARTAKGKMENASANLDYESAARWRDIWNALKSFEKGALPQDPDHRKNSDVVACLHHRGWFIIVILQVRNGLLSDSNIFQHRAMKSWREQAASFFLEYYASHDCPDEIIMEELFEHQESCQEILSDRKGRSVQFKKPRGEFMRNWMVMTRQNAKTELSCREATGELDGQEFLVRIREELGLKNIPVRTIGLDAAIFGKEEPVGSVVVFHGGKPEKKEYRKFKIKSSDHPLGDVHHIHEILTRYLKKCDDENFPDAILIDGGLAQLMQARSVLEDINRSADLIAIVKGEGRRSGLEKLYVNECQEGLGLEQAPVSMRFWAEVRDEAHRFANAFNRKRVLNRRLQSPFKKIPGIGPKSEKRLRDVFVSYTDMLKAQASEIDAIKGLTVRQKNMIKAWIQAQRD